MDTNKAQEETKPKKSEPKTVGGSMMKHAKGPTDSDKTPTSRKVKAQDGPAAPSLASHLAKSEGISIEHARARLEHSVSKAQRCEIGRSNGVGKHC